VPDSDRSKCRALEHEDYDVVTWVGRNQDHPFKAMPAEDTSAAHERER